MARQAGRCTRGWRAPMRSNRRLPNPARPFHPKRSPAPSPPRPPLPGARWWRSTRRPRGCPCRAPRSFWRWRPARPRTCPRQRCPAWLESWRWEERFRGRRNGEVSSSEFYSSFCPSAFHFAPRCDRLKGAVPSSHTPTDPPHLSSLPSRLARPRPETPAAFPFASFPRACALACSPFSIALTQNGPRVLPPRRGGAETDAGR